jgi:hypothetical protein
LKASISEQYIAENGATVQHKAEAPLSVVADELCYSSSGFLKGKRTHMPTESRSLQFSSDEVRVAMRDYCYQTGRLLPDHGTIVVKGEQISLPTNSQLPSEDVEFTESEVAAALMMFCIKENIPIARRATKSLQITREHVFLRLDLN